MKNDKTFKMRIKEAVDNIYEMMKDGNYQGVSRFPDLQDKVQRYLQRRGVIIKTGYGRNAVYSWRAGAPAPTRTLYDNIASDHKAYLEERARTRKHEKPAIHKPKELEPSWKQLERFTDEQLMEELFLRRGYMSLELNDNGTVNILQQRKETIDIQVSVNYETR